MVLSLCPCVLLCLSTQKHLHMELKESWYEKLCRWDEALDAYEKRCVIAMVSMHWPMQMCS